MLHDRVSALLGTIYEAPYDEARWDRMALDICAALNCRALLISAVDAKNQSLSSTSWYGADDTGFARATEEYSNSYYQIDPSIGYAARFPSGRLCDISQVMSREQISRDEFMRFYTDRFKSPYFVVGYSPPDDGLTFGISVHPGFRDQPLDVRLLELLSDHVKRSVSLAARPPSLENETGALLLLRGSGKVVAMSALAESYLSSHDGLGLADGLLVAASSSDTRAIGRAVYAAASPATSGSAGTLLFVGRPSLRRDWLLSVTPYVASATAVSAFQPKAMIRIVDPSRRHSLGAAVCEQFKLTEREAQVASLLLNGHSPSSAARCLEISENTAKVHLQAIYRKTQTNRQAELVKLLLEVS